MSTSHLIETSDRDSFLLVAEYVGQLLNDGKERTALAETPGSKFVDACETALAEQRYEDALSLLAQHVDTVISKVQDSRDVECCINHMCHLLSRSAAAGLPGINAALQLADTLAAKKEPHPEARLAALAELYSVVSDYDARYTILMQLLQYALDTGAADSVTTILKSLLDSWLDKTTLSVPQQQQLLLAAADLYRVSKRKRTGSREAFHLVIRCLDLPSDPAATTQQQAAALQRASYAAVLDFLRTPDLFHFDVWESPHVQSLKSKQQTSGALELLRTLVEGNIKDFEDVCSSGKADAVLEAAGVSMAELTDKARVMTIAAMARGKQQLALQEIQGVLGISEAEVEPIVVRAIGRGLIEGRVDQLSGIVTVTHAASRTFGSEQWQELQDQLRVWREQLHAIQDVITSQKSQFMPNTVPLVKSA